MSVQPTCVVCCQASCKTAKQSDFDALQVNSTDGHDQILADARMLHSATSTESKKTTTKSYNMSTQKHADYFLKRMMASFDKLTSFLQRRPRANTNMEARAHPAAAPQRHNTN